MIIVLCTYMFAGHEFGASAWLANKSRNSLVNYTNLNGLGLHGLYPGKIGEIDYPYWVSQILQVLAGHRWSILPRSLETFKRNSLEMEGCKDLVSAPPSPRLGTGYWITWLSRLLRLPLFYPSTRAWGINEFRRVPHKGAYVSYAGQIIFLELSCV